MLDLSIWILALSVHDRGHQCSKISWKIWVLEPTCSAFSSLGTRYILSLSGLVSLSVLPTPLLLLGSLDLLTHY